MKFFEHYQKVCHAHGKSPSSIALAAGLSKSNVTGWKAGQSPSLDTLIKLSQQLEINPKELVPEEVD